MIVQCRVLCACIVACALTTTAAAQAQHLEQDDRIERALASTARPVEHRLRDETRQPEQLFSLLDLNQGEIVLDVGAGGGYLTRIALELVGEHGRVDLHNTPGWIAQFPSMAPEILTQSFESKNVDFVTAPWDQLAQPAGTYDAILLGQVYHDVILEGADVETVNQNLFAMLKPGGRLLIEDHEADGSMPIGKQVGLHRINREVVVQALAAAGFEAAASAEIVSPHEDLRFNVFRPGLRGRTSRFILVFRKPD